MTNDSKIIVGVYEDMPDEFEGVVAEVMHFCQTDLEADDRFNWNNFLNRVGKRPNADLTISKFINDKVVRQNADVESVVCEATKLLVEGLKIPIENPDTSSLKLKVKCGFTNQLKTIDGGFLSRTVNNGNTCWEYSVLFAVPIPNNRNRFTAYLSTFKVESKCSHTEIFRCITVDSVSNYSVEIKAAKMIVSKRFHSTLQETHVIPSTTGYHHDKYPFIAPSA
ncbi:hypothetical protein BGW41_000169 [Actinomortierella wolfii]|nr:hypothetical protein BGW41_000169 [Actinomortierella wolfii]